LRLRTFDAVDGHTVNIVLVLALRVVGSLVNQISTYRPRAGVVAVNRTVPPTSQALATQRRG
jgi:hypothetical protein